MASGFSLKDELYNAGKVAGLAQRFGAASSDFDADRFEAAVMSRLLDLELKERITWIAECLRAELPDTLDAAAPILIAALPAPLDPTLSDDDFGDFIYAPLGEVVVALGLDTPEPALAVIEEITQRFSMEWAVRPFLNHWPEETLAVLTDWTGHPNYHVRRLVSEGTRPRLPWAQGIALPLDRALPLLDRLHADPTRYVTRSVANHINDITKKDAGLALDRLDIWASEARQHAKELSWMTAHALRGLVKSGHPRALQTLGFDPDAPIELTALGLPDKIAIGETLKIDLTLMARAPTKAIVDYIFWRRKANGELTSKVQKIKQVSLKPDTPVSLSKLHKLKGDATTYSLFPGQHRIEIQVNGKVLGGADFTLTG